MRRRPKAEMMVETHQFQAFIRQKRRFLVTATVGFTGCYLLLPLAIGIVPQWMNRPSPMYGLPWGWWLAFAQVFMTWFFAWVYWRRAKSFDAIVEEIKKRNCR